MCWVNHRGTRISRSRIAAEGEVLIQRSSRRSAPNCEITRKRIALFQRWGGTADSGLGWGGRIGWNRVFFGFSRAPFGSMAEWTVARRSMCIPLPDRIDDVQAAAIANPGMSAWLSMRDRAGLQKGETVLILGATGVAGQLAIQVARYLGAKRIVAAGRNLDALASENLDGMVSLAQGDDAVREAFAAEAGKGIDVVIDYLWGRPTELLLEALARNSIRTAADRRAWWR